MLTGFLDRPAIREAFRAHAVRPTLTAQQRSAPLLVPSATAKASTVGTAFSYLARFRTARDVVRDLPGGGVTVWDGGWIAERSLAEMEAHPRFSGFHRRWARITASARVLLDDFVAGRETSMDRVARCCQCLGALDLLARIGDFNAAFVPRDDVQTELLALDRIFDPVALLRPQHTCVLNPVFAAGEAIGGVDADLLVDGRITGIRTTATAAVSAHHLRQLAGHAVLLAAGGVSLTDGSLCMDPPETVGVYFSRHALLVSWPLATLFPGSGFARFSDVFRAEMETAAGEAAPASISPDTALSG